MARPRVRIAVRLTPRAAANRIDGVRDGVLRIRVTPAPVDDAANDALVRLLARSLSIAPSSIRLVRGATGRDKVVELDGVDEGAVRARWPDLGV